MKLSTLNSKLNLLSVGTNAKTIKGDVDNRLTAIQYLAPSIESGYDACPHASEGCRSVCLYTSGRGNMGSVKQARIRKTKLLFENQKEYLEMLDKDLSLFSEYCSQNALKGFVRLNGTSDIDYSQLLLDELSDAPMNVFEKYSDIQFYDYTKDHKRESKHDNYYLLYSRGEDTKLSSIKSLIKKKKNVAVVFDDIPDTWEGLTVINGDEDDVRPEDPRGVVVGLKAKGKARKDNGNGFVINVRNI